MQIHLYKIKMMKAQTKGTLIAIAVLAIPVGFAFMQEKKKRENAEKALAQLRNETSKNLL